MDNCYGNDNPPYTLYQSDEGLYGLRDKDGLMLPAVFHRDGDKFWKKTNEALCFNPDEGFELMAWYDPDDWD